MVYIFHVLQTSWTPCNSQILLSYESPTVEKSMNSFQSTSSRLAFFDAVTGVPIYLYDGKVLTNLQSMMYSEVSIGKSNVQSVTDRNTFSASAGVVCGTILC